MFLVSFFLIFTNFEKVIVGRKGRIVQMRIEKLPKSCIGSRVRYNVFYSYKGKLYAKMTRGDFCEKHYVGELIEMKFLEGYKTILRPGESAILQILAFGALGILGLIISISQWRKLVLLK